MRMCAVGDTLHDREGMVVVFMRHSTTEKWFENEMTAFLLDLLGLHKYRR